MRRQLNFITKRKCRNGDFDITVKTLKTRILIVFRDGTHKKITKTEYMVLAVSDNRMYFKEETPVNGYKMCDYSKGLHRVITLPRNNLEMVSVWVFSGVGVGSGAGASWPSLSLIPKMSPPFR